ncbi:MAG: hypothetical protein J0L69_01920 [Bacteroidetes bacterium]|nr:hypothetical protein [Bacteroidota bacterium]
MKMNEINQRTKAKHSLCFLAISFAVVTCFSQTTTLKSIHKDLTEKAYIATPALGTVEPTVFEAGIMPSKYFDLYQNKIGVAANFRLIIRMLNTRSLPINAPSYMPDVTFYSLLNKKDSCANIAILTLGHHSNGQDHAFYNPEGGVNLVNGNFSTNYLRAGIIKKTFSKKHQNTTYYKIAIEQHLNIDRNVELNGKYGFTRLKTGIKSVNNSLNRFIKRIKENNYVSAELNTDWIFDKLIGIKATDASKRLITSLTLSYKPSFCKDFSLFVQSYRGQDYYNIHFVKTLSFVRFGLSAEPSALINALKS